MDEKTKALMLEQAVDIMTTKLLFGSLLTVLVERGIMPQEVIGEVFDNADTAFRAGLPPGASREFAERVSAKLTLMKGSRH